MEFLSSVPLYAFMASGQHIREVLGPDLRPVLIILAEIVFVFLSSPRQVLGTVP
jgi:hypothetical protein